jgi:hypothetical protein
MGFFMVILPSLFSLGRAAGVAEVATAKPAAVNPKPEARA